MMQPNVERNAVGEAVRLTFEMDYDWHLHLRDGEHMRSAVKESAKQFCGAIIMPNLVPPVTMVDLAGYYRDRILRALPSSAEFEPLMTLYLTDNTSPEEIRRAKRSRFVKAVKYYPAGATTNSDSGVTDIKKAYPAIEAMEEVGLVLCVHGEVTDSEVDIFDREYYFIHHVLEPLLSRFRHLRVVFEHVTTQDGVNFVMQTGPNVGATIAPQYLLYNRNHLFEKGICPHRYSLPILKARSPHQQALLAAATSGNQKFFLGTDSAPHARHTKENACGCAGCYSAPHALELYAMAFDQAGKIGMLPGFVGAGKYFYDLRASSRLITLVKEPQVIKEELDFGADKIVPFMAGETLPWRLAD